MDPVTQARMAAMNAVVGSTPYHISVEICRCRGLNPDYPSASGMSNWQSIIMEVMLLESLRAAL